MTPTVPPEDPRPGGGSEHAKILSEVMEDQKRRQEARESVSRTKETSDASFFVQVALLVMTTLFFYLLFFSPTWVAPGAPPEISSERTEASLRWYLYTMSGQIERFEQENGRLPSSVEEIPGVKPGTTYTRVGAQEYSISYTDGTVVVMFASSVDPATFLGDASEVVLGTGT